MPGDGVPDDDVPDDEVPGNRQDDPFVALAQPGIRGLRAYDPGHDLVALRRRAGPDGLVELGSNENPYGASPAALAAAQAALRGLHLYPDPRGGQLRQALADVHGVAADEIILGNGSHELLMQLGQVFAGPGKTVVVSQYGFAVHSLAAQASGASLQVATALPRSDAMARGHDLDALLAAITPGTGLLFLANPNNPTGTWCSGDALAGFMAQVPGDVIVVVDEAYAEYVDAADYHSALGLLKRFRNLVVTRTFSKVHALAGLRVGYAIADRRLIAVLERVRESFNVNGVGLAAALAALGDQPHVQASIAGNATQRARMCDGLRPLGWFVHPSQTNFILAEGGPDTDVAVVEQTLLDHGIVVRPMAGYGLPRCLRITVGTAPQNQRLLDVLGAGTR